MNYTALSKRFNKLITRHVLHLLLGFFAFFCLALGIFSPRSTSIQSSSAIRESDAQTTTLSTTTTTLAPPVDAVVRPISSNSLTATQVARLPSVNLSIQQIQKSSEKQEAIKPDWHTFKIQKNDTLAKIFKRRGYSKTDLNAIVQASAREGLQLTSLRPTSTIKVLLGAQKTINALSLEITPGHTLLFSRKGKEPITTTAMTPQKSIIFGSERSEPSLEKQLAFSKGKIRSSLFSAGKNAGLDRKVIAQMVDIFGSNINFVSGLKPNGSFRVLFEEKRLNNGRVGTGPILVAEIVNNGKKYQAVRYTDKQGRTSYFSPEGYGMRQTQTFLRSPLNFTRVSSRFGQRCHPYSHQWKEHKGVDLVAPSGTPVQAVGNAKVIFAGTRGGYGRVVELRHGPRYVTLYAHLSRFGKNVTVGAEVKQGQIIGYVGRTGFATGDHLHYEFHVNKIACDPFSAHLPPQKNNSSQIHINPISWHMQGK